MQYISPFLYEFPHLAYTIFASLELYLFMFFSVLNSGGIFVPEEIHLLAVGFGVTDRLSRGGSRRRLFQHQVLIVTYAKHQFKMVMLPATL